MKKSTIKSMILLAVGGAILSISLSFTMSARTIQGSNQEHRTAPVGGFADDRK